MSVCVTLWKCDSKWEYVLREGEIYRKVIREREKVWVRYKRDWKIWSVYLRERKIVHERIGVWEKGRVTQWDYDRKWEGLTSSV